MKVLQFMKNDITESNVELELESDARNDAEAATRMKHQYFLMNRRKYIIAGAAVIVIALILVGLTISSLSNCGDAHEPELIQTQYLQDTKHPLDNNDQDVKAKPNNGICDDLPNDILSMARGIDITKLDIFPTTVEGLRNNPGFARQVIKLSCKEQYFKKDGNGILIQLPDQIKPSAYEILAGLVSSNITSRHTEKHSEDVKKQMAMDVGVSFKLGMFSGSAFYKDKRKSFISNKVSFTESKIAHLVRRVDFSRSSTTGVLDPHEDLLILLRALPDTFSKNPSGYLDVINQFGTHYFVSAKFGGFIQNSTEISEGTQDSANSTEFGGHLNADVKLVANVAVGGQSSQNETTNKVSVNTFTKKLVYGGSIPLGYSGDLGKWIESVEKSPTLFSGRLIPISTLVNEELKAKALDKATQVYLGLAYVQDLREQLDIIRQERAGTDLTEINDYIKSLKNQSIQVLSDPEQLAKLGEEVTALINSAPIPISSVRNHLQGFATITVIEASLPPAKFLRFRRDSFVETKIGKSNNPGIAIVTNSTRTIRNNNRPNWNEKFTVPMERDGTIEFCIYDRGWLITAAKVEKMGCAEMTIREIMKKGLNDTPTRAVGLSYYYGKPMQLVVRVAWYQREVMTE